MILLIQNYNRILFCVKIYYMATTEKPISEKQAMKKKLVHNLIELVIWCVLLWMCYGYIQTHPAEKISFFSWYKVIYQQTEIFFQNIFGKNWELLRQKYNLESYYQVLITLSEEKPCIDPEIVTDLHQTYEKLQDEPKNTLEHTLQYYVDKQYEFDDKLKVECPIETEELVIPGVVEEISPEAEILW